MGLYSFQMKYVRTAYADHDFNIQSFPLDLEAHISHLEWIMSGYTRILARVAMRQEGDTFHLRIGTFLDSKDVLLLVEHVCKHRHFVKRT